MLLLRVTAAVTLVMDVGAWTVTAAGAWTTAVLVGVAGCVCLGALTPVAAALGLAVELVHAFGGGDVCTIVVGVDMLVVALIGPGAYSVDARKG